MPLLAMASAFAALVAPVAGHGTIVLPAMRNNPTVDDGYCPYCQGSLAECQNRDISQCAPHVGPCWGAPYALTVSASQFHEQLASVKHPDGSYWIDQDGGKWERPLWCPGDIMPIRYYINADHNGVFQWESQLASPGQELEENFATISPKMSVNNYQVFGESKNSSDTPIVGFANYFRAEDGVTEIPRGSCRNGDDWTVQKSHCMDNMFAETSLILPSDMPAGNTVVRWRWFGAANQNGVVPFNTEAERSLFVSCKDVIVGTPEECAARDAGVSV